jgi:hypothetical protein
MGFHTWQLDPHVVRPINPRGDDMHALKWVSGFLSVVLFAGCASFRGIEGPCGPKITGTVQASDSGGHASVGVEFSTWSDFVAVVFPSRWKSPLKTGGSLSWINPNAWRADAGRTGRILMGQTVAAVVIAAAVSADDGSGGSDGDLSLSPPDDGGDPVDPGPGTPPPPPPPPPP